MKVLIFDPFAGISGDMLLGALLDLGLEASWLERFISGLGLGDIGVTVQRTHRRGIDSVRVGFNLPHEHAHRHLEQVVAIIKRSAATDLTKARAIEAFTLLATAEAEVHGTSVEKVHFHEVGALDAILDVLCSLAAIEQLEFEDFFTRPVAVGQGWIDIEHGRFPVPAPATLKLLAGITVTGHELPGECTTPTGAAILATLTGGRPAPAAFRVLRSGYGAGTRDPADRPNVLRLIAAEIEPAADTLYVVQADVDDLSAEYVPAAQEALLRAGALDAVVSNIAMKKGRPAVRFEALAPEPALDSVLNALFASTTTIGARYWAVQRPALTRTESELEWRGQRIRRKEVVLPDGTVRSKAEYEDVLRAAEALGMSALEVRRALDTLTGGRS